MAEQIVGPGWTSYEQTVEHILQMDDMIYTLSPNDIPLTMGIGGNGVPIIGSRPVANRTFWWQEEEMPLPRGVAAEAIDGSETEIDVPAGSAVKWAIGDSIRIDDEIVIVTDVDTVNDDITVVRGARGTSATTHSDGVDMIGLGTSLPEGQLGGGNYLGRDKYSNYTQIFSGQVQASRTEQSIPKYGVSNELVKQTAARMHHLQLGIENAALYGIKYNDDATRTRLTGGLKSFITNSANVDSSADWMTLKTVEALLAVIHDAGGNTDGMTLLAKELNFEALNNLTDTGRVTTQEYTDEKRGRQKARVLMTEYGDVTLARDRWAGSGDAFLYHPENFVKRDFQPLIMQPLAKTDDTDKYMMVAECGFELKGADHAARFSVLDATQDLPTSGLV